MTKPAAQNISQRAPASAELIAVMEQLRKIVLDHHTLITHRRLSPAAGKALAAQVREIADALATRSPENAIVASWAREVSASAVLMQQGPASAEMMQGLMQLVSVLDAYPRTFEHPGWTSLQNAR